MDINVETAKRMLKEEVENAPYVIEESFGNAGTYRLKQKSPNGFG